MCFLIPNSDSAVMPVPLPTGHWFGTHRREDDMGLGGLGTMPLFSAGGHRLRTWPSTGKVGYSVIAREGQKVRRNKNLAPRAASLWFPNRSAMEVYREKKGLNLKLIGILGRWVGIN